MNVAQVEEAGRTFDRVERSKQRVDRFCVLGRTFHIQNRGLDGVDVFTCLFNETYDHLRIVVADHQRLSNLRRLGWRYFRGGFVLHLIGGVPVTLGVYWIDGPIRGRLVWRGFC